MNNHLGQLVHLCKHCRMVPAAFRARDAVCYDRFALSRARAHRSICRGEGIDLSLTAGAFTTVAAALNKEPVELIQHKSFQDLVSAVVGGNQDLKQAFTEGVLAKLQNQNGVNGSTSDSSGGSRDPYHGIWKQFPHTVSFENVESVFQEMAASLEIATTFRESTALVDYLMILSPSFFRST